PRAAPRAAARAAREASKPAKATVLVERGGSSVNTSVGVRKLGGRAHEDLDGSEPPPSARGIDISFINRRFPSTRRTLVRHPAKRGARDARQPVHPLLVCLLIRGL